MVFGLFHIFFFFSYSRWKTSSSVSLYLVAVIIFIFYGFYLLPNVYSFRTVFLSTLWPFLITGLFLNLIYFSVLVSFFSNGCIPYFGRFPSSVPAAEKYFLACHHYLLINHHYFFVYIVLSFYLNLLYVCTYLISKLLPYCTKGHL